MKKNNQQFLIKYPKQKIIFRKKLKKVLTHQNNTETIPQNTIDTINKSPNIILSKKNIKKDQILRKQLFKLKDNQTRRFLVSPRVNSPYSYRSENKTHRVYTNQFNIPASPKNYKHRIYKKLGESPQQKINLEFKDLRIQQLNRKDQSFSSKRSRADNLVFLVDKLRKKSSYDSLRQEYKASEKIIENLKKSKNYFRTAYFHSLQKISKLQKNLKQSEKKNKIIKQIYEQRLRFFSNKQKSNQFLKSQTHIGHLFSYEQFDSACILGSELIVEQSEEQFSTLETVIKPTQKKLKLQINNEYYSTQQPIKNLKQSTQHSIGTNTQAIEDLEDSYFEAVSKLSLNSRQ